MRALIGTRIRKKFKAKPALLVLVVAALAISAAAPAAASAEPWGHTAAGGWAVGKAHTLLSNGEHRNIETAGTTGAVLRIAVIGGEVPTEITCSSMFLKEGSIEETSSTTAEGLAIIRLSGCSMAKPAECSVPTTITFQPTRFSIKGSVAVFTPTNGNAFLFELPIEECVFSGTEPVYGTMTAEVEPAEVFQIEQPVRFVGGATLSTVGDPAEFEGEMELVTSDEKLITAFGSKGSGNGQLTDPQAVAVDSKGNIWVADTGNDRVEEFSRKGAYLGQVGNGQLEEPRAVQIGAEGNVWVGSGANSGIKVFSPAGALEKEVPTIFTTSTMALEDEGFWAAGGGYLLRYGPEEGSVEAGIWTANGEPTGIVPGPGGSVWVVEEGGFITHYNAQAEVLQEFDEHGSGAGKLSYQTGGLVIDFEGNFWVADGSRLVEYSPNGKFLQELNTSNLNATILSAGGLALDWAGGLVVADTGGNRIQVWHP